jgi:hypothetical protein
MRYAFVVLLFSDVSIFNSVIYAVSFFSQSGRRGDLGKLTSPNFFLEHAGELCIILLIEEGWSHTERPRTHTQTHTHKTLLRE